MFEVGFAELLVVAIVGLIILGPEQLPDTLRYCTGWWHRINRQIRSVQSDIAKELRIEEMRREAEKLNEETIIETAISQKESKGFTGANPFSSTANPLTGDNQNNPPPKNLA